MPTNYDIKPRKGRGLTRRTPWSRRPEMLASRLLAFARAVELTTEHDVPDPVRDELLTAQAALRRAVKFARMTRDRRFE